MARIQRRDFENRFRNHRIHIGRLPPQTIRALASHGVTPERIARIAGDDHVISGREFNQLYEALAVRQGSGGRRVDERVSEALFQALASRAERVDTPAATPDAFRGSGRARATGIGATQPSTPPPVATPVLDGATPQSEPAPPPPAYVLPPSFDERSRRVGRERKTTHTQIDPDVLETARQIAALPPSESRGHVAVSAYLSAASARDDRARLTASGDRRGAARVGRPEGVPARIWNMTAALESRGISANDAAHYVATGTLPDLLDETGEVVQSGDDRLAALHRAATHQGSWTAVNSFTFLVSMRRSAMGAERRAAATFRDGLPDGDARRAQITAGIDASVDTDRALGRDLNGIYRAATGARERTGASLVRRADRMTTEAAQARAAGDETRAVSLEASAQQVRDRGARISHAEGQYRASMPSYRSEAGRLFRLAASAQIGTGEAQIRTMVTGGAPLSAEPPAVLGTGDAATTGNGVPGAGRLLGTARTVDPNSDSDDQQHALEGRRAGAIANFHRTHLVRGGYGARVAPGPNGTPPARSASLVAHRQSYLGARVDQAQAASSGIAIASIEPPSVERDLRIAGLQAERRGVADEFAQVLGQSMASDRQVTAARARVVALEGDVADARTQVTDATAAANDANDGFTRAVDADDAVFGDSLKTSGEARRDDEGVTDGRAVRDIERGRVHLARARHTGALGALGDARDGENHTRAQASRDAQDADLVVGSMADFPTVGLTNIPTPRSVREGYDRARDFADVSALGERQALGRASTALPRGADAEPTRIAIASRRVDLARYDSRSAEAQVTALGEGGRRGATRRLDASAALLSQADGTRRTLAEGSDERVVLAAGIVTAHTELATANGDYRPATARTQLADAETITDTDLLPHDLERAGAAYLAIGHAGTVSLARMDQRFDAILDDGHYVAGAADDMYRQAHRMLDPAAPGTNSVDLANNTNRGDLIPHVAAADRARDLLGRFDRSLDAVDDMMDAAGGQVTRGQRYARARTRSLGHSEIQAAQAQVSTVISGGAWLLSAGQFDMKDQMADAGESSMRHRLHWIDQDAARMGRGMTDMAASYVAARQEGRAFEWLHAVRIFSDRSRSSTMPETYRAAFMAIDRGLSDTRARAADWQRFNTVAIRQGHVPIAAALRGPTLGFEPSLQTLGDERIMAVTPEMMDSLDAQAASLRETTDGMMWIIGINTGLEAGLGMMLTAGIGSGAAVAEGANAANSVRIAASAVNAARNATVAMRALHVARTIGTVTVVGGGMMAANYAVGRLVGRNTGVARGFEALTNFIPIGAGQRAAGIGRAAQGADDVAAAATRLQRLRQAMSWSHVRELSNWSRALGPVALGGAQAFATTVATPWVAQRVGLERSELGQAAIGLALNAAFAGGMAAVTSGRAPSRAMAEHLVQSTRAEGGRVPRGLRARVQGDLDAFARRTEGRIPTEAEVTQLRTQLRDRLGLSESSPDVGERRAMVDGAIEAIRIDRAVRIGAAEAGEGASPHRALEVAADRLYGARGAEDGGTSRLQAFRDVAMHMSERLGADATQAYQSGNATRGDQLVQQRAALGDRATAAEVVDGASRTAPTESGLRTARGRRRAEAILTEELTTSRGQLDAADGRPLAAADYDRVAQRLVDEGGLTPGEAATLVEGARRELLDQGVVRHLAAAQAAAGERPLTNAEVDAIATDLGRRVGLSDPTAFAQRIVQQRPALERTGVVRLQTEGPNAIPTDAAMISRRATEAAAAEPAIARFIEQRGAPAEQLVGMIGQDAFMRAFADDGHVAFDAHRLLDLPPARMRELATAARDNPAQVRQLVDALSGPSRDTVLRAVRDVGVEPASRLAAIAAESPQGFGYLRSLEGGETRLIDALRADPVALRQAARAAEKQIFLRANDGTYLLRGDAPEAVPPPTRAEMEGIARRAGVDPAVLDNPSAHPQAMSRLAQQMRLELSPEGRAALAREIDGRRFVDETHYEEARNAGVDNPEHRYGRRDFEAWQRAESIMRGAAERGEPLTVDTLLQAHRAASEGILSADRRGRLRSAPSETVFQGGDGPMGIQEVSTREFEALRNNPNLTVGDLGATESGGRRVVVEYTAPTEVRSRLETMLRRVDERLAAGEDPVAVAADAQREFVSIHPFLDGNGRMSRLVMDYVFQRSGIEPPVVRDPNLDTQLSPSAWRAEVRRGLTTPLEATQRMWSRARRGMPSPDGAHSPPGTPTPPHADRFSRRDTLGWTGRPTANPPAGREHLGVIHRGVESMPPRVRERLDMLLARAEDAAPHLVAERDRLGARQTQLYQEHGALLSGPTDRLSPTQQTRRREVEGALAQVQTRMSEVDRGIRTSRREARQLALTEMSRFRRSLLHRVDGPAAERRAAALTVAPSAASRTSATDLRTWAADFFRLVGRDVGAERIELVHADPRAHAGRDGRLNVGDNPTQALVFHELGHYLEYADPAVARAARQWVIARSEMAGGGEAHVRPIRDLTGSEFYGPSERAYEDHFENPYVGKDYGADAATEVVSVGLEHLTNADRMLHLYQRDPEHFFFIMGVLDR